MTANPLSPLTTVGNSVGVPPGHPAPPPSRLTPLDPVRVLRQHLRLLIAALIVGLVVGTTIYLLLKHYASEYVTEAQLEATGGIADALSAPQGPGAPGLSHGEGNISPLIQSQIAILRSDDVINEALKNAGVQQTHWFQSMATAPAGQDPTPLRMAAALVSLQTDFTAGATRGSPLIAVSLRGSYPDDIQRVLGAVIDAYLQQNSISIERMTEGVQAVFTNQKRTAEADIRQIQEQLRASSVDMPLLEARNSQAAQAFEALTREEVQGQIELDGARQALKALEGGLRSGQVSASPEDLAVVEADPSVSARDERLRELHEHRVALLAEFGENHRAVRELDQEVLAMQQERQHEVDRLLRERQAVNLDMARTKVAALEGSLGDLQANLSDAKTKVDTLTSQMAEVRRLQGMLTEAHKRADEADDQLHDMQIRGQRPDAPPVQSLVAPTPPKLVFPLPGSVIGGTTTLFVILVCGMVFLKELLDQRIKTPADIKLLPQADLLGVLPDANDDPLGSGRIEGVVGRDPSSLMAEAFRQVRSAVLTAMDRNGYKTLMIVGAHPGAGVSCVTQNLAVSLAAVGRRVLVIEANLRRPAVHRLFEGPMVPGLVEVLRGSVKFDEAVVRRSNVGVDVLTLGEGADAAPEMFESSTFTSLLHRVSSRYDLVLVDAPPALLASESHLLARNVDAAVTVVRAMREKRGAIARMLRQLRGQRAELLGVIVNGVKSSAGGYFRSNYEEFYRYRRPGQSRAASVDQAGPLPVLPRPDQAQGSDSNAR